MLAESIPLLSFDLLSIIADYAVYNTPQKKSPIELHRFGQPGEIKGTFFGGVTCVSYAPDHTLWIADRNSVQIFSCEGQFLRKLECSLLGPVGIAFDTDNEVFILVCGRFVFCVLILCALGRGQALHFGRVA